MGVSGKSTGSEVYQFIQSQSAPSACVIGTQLHSSMSVSPMGRMELSYSSFQGDRMNDTEVKLLHTMVPNDRVSLKEAGM